VSTRVEGGSDIGVLRRLLLAVTVVGILGLALELLFLEHWESVWQWVPFVVLGVGLLSAILVWRWPSPATLRFFAAMMALFVVAGAIGLVLHYQGNAEFELERHPEMRGLPLLWSSLRGATPALAPGALAQLGLVGLTFAYRHPALRRRASDR
jgi:hypothetical protein